jgi:hypothetical protein
MADTVPGQEQINAMSASEYKVLENRCRRAARRRGLVLRKSRARDPRAQTYRTYGRADTNTREHVAGNPDTGYGLTLTEVALYLFDSPGPFPIHLERSVGREFRDFNETNGEPILSYRTPTAHQLVNQQRLRKGQRFKGGMPVGWVLSYLTKGDNGIGEHITGITDLNKVHEAAEAAQQHLASIGYKVPGNPKVANDSRSVSTDPYDVACLEIIDFLNKIPKVIDFRLPAVQEGSRMAEDVAVIADPNIGHICSHYYGASVDYLRGLYQLLRSAEFSLQLPMFAAYPLIRGVIEASGQVVWVLGPKDRRERFLRMLQLQKAELIYDGKYVDARTRPHDDDTAEIRSAINAFREQIAHAKEGRRKQLLSAAAALEIEQAEFEQGLPGGYSELIREAVAEQGLDSAWRGREGAGIWVFISGLSHPSFSRAFAGSIKRPVDVNGEFRWLTEPNPQVMRDGITAALSLHQRATILWRKAATSAADE